MVLRARELQARVDLAASAAAHNPELVAEVVALRREVDTLTEVALMLVRLEREEAEGKLDALQRELEAALVRLAQRHPARPLH